MITNMSAIDTNTEEGRFLVAAIRILSGYTEGAEGMYLEQVRRLQAEMYERAGPCPVPPEPTKPRFESFFHLGHNVGPDEHIVKEWYISKVQAIIRSMTPDNMAGLFVMEEVETKSLHHRKFVIKSTF